MHVYERIIGARKRYNRWFTNRNRHRENSKWYIYIFFTTWITFTYFRSITIPVNILVFFFFFFFGKRIKSIVRQVVYFRFFFFASTLTLITFLSWVLVKNKFTMFFSLSCLLPIADSCNWQKVVYHRVLNRSYTRKELAMWFWTGQLLWLIILVH